MEDEDFEKITFSEKKNNYQYPKKEKTKEVFIVVLIGENFLVLKDVDENNIRVRNVYTNSFSVGEKIYKEDGKFSWEMG